MWSQEGQREPATGRMGPLLGQEKFPKSSAQLNGVPGGQGGVQEATGGAWGAGRLQWELSASVGISGESSALKGDCLPPCSGLPWETAGEAKEDVQFPPQQGCRRFGVATEEAGMVGWPPLEEGEPLGFSPSDSLSLEGRFSGLDEAGFPEKRR